MPIFILFTSVISVLALLPNTAYSATSATLNFQGRLLDNSGNLVTDGSYNIEFKLYDDEFAGTNLWTETRSGGNAISVQNGYFSVYLGDVTAFGAINWDQELFLTMNVNSDGEMSPRLKLTAVPYAFRAGAITDSAGNAYTGDDLIQAAPSSVQTINAAVAALRLNQTGSGNILQLQGDGSNVFTVDKAGTTTIASGLTVGNSASTASGTIRWSGTDLEGYTGSGWVSLTAGGGGGSSFLQDGNGFGETATLGTTDTFGLNIITDGNTAIGISTTGLATFYNGITLDTGNLNLNSNDITNAGDITGSAGLTLASGGAGDLTLDSASGVLVIADSTIRRSAAGTTVIDLLDSSANTTLSIQNSDGTRVADLLVEGGVTATSFSGSGSGLTSLDAGNISSGTLADARLSSNVALLNGNQTFTGRPTFNSGLTLGNTANTTAGNIRWTGTDFEGYDGTQWVSLTSGSGGGSPLSVSLIQVYDSTGGLSLSASTAVIPWDAELKKDSGFTHDIVTANSRVTLDSAGWYRISYSVAAITSSNARANLQCQIRMNGSTILQEGTSYSYARTTSDPYTSNNASTYVQTTSANEYYEIICAQVGTANPTQNTVANQSWTIAEKTVDGSGGGGNSFEQGGNSFGAKAILGTTDSFGIDIVANGSAALTISSSGEASFTNGLTISSGNLSVDSGTITSTSGLTITSGGAGNLTLDSASDVLIIADPTLRRSAAGTTTIDLLDSSGDTTLQITNSDGARVAGLDVEGTVTAGGFSGNGSSLTNLDGSAIASGTVADARLSSNVALLNANQTFTGVPTFNSGLILGNSTGTTAGTIRWSGTDFEGYDGVEWKSLTSGGGGGGGGSSSPALTTVTKPTNENLNSSTTLQNDNHLLFSLGANETWSFRFVVQANTPIAAGIKFAVTAPSGATCQVSVIDQQTAASQSGISCGVASVTLTGTGANEVYEVVGTVVNGSTAGNVTLQWAQGTASGTTTVLAGSYLTASVDGGGLVLLQGGNSFGSTAIVGTKDANGLSIITNNSTAISIDSSGVSTFTNDVNLSAKLLLGSPPSPDSAAQGVIYTAGVSNKGLVIQGVSSQTANLLEIQDNSGNVNAAFEADGGLVLGRGSAVSGTIQFFNSSNNNSVVLDGGTVTGARVISLPDANGTICLEGSAACGFMTYATGSYLTDATTNNTIAINKTGASGNLIALQKNGGAVFTVANTGSLQIQDTSTTALDIRNTGGTSYFTVNTSTGVATANSLVVTNSFSGAGLTDCDATYSTLKWDSATGQFSCGTSRPALRSFVDTTADALVDADTTNYWDTGAENNNATPNITPTTASGVSVFGTVTFELTSNTNQDVEATARVVRGIGSVPSCTTGTAVGGYPGIFATNNGAIKSSTVTFVDNPNTTSPVYYILCSDSSTAGNLSANITRIRITLQEVSNSN